MGLQRVAVALLRDLMLSIRAPVMYLLQMPGPGGSGGVTFKDEKELEMSHGAGEARH